MTWFMIEAELFQESIEGKADVAVLWDEHDGYFVPYRDRSDKVRVRVFTHNGSSDHSAPEFFAQFPESTRRHTQDGILGYAPGPRTSVVYFIGDGDAVKIGISKNPKKRLRQLQTGHPKKLSILATFPGAADEEMQFHGRFRPHHLQGEWFRYCDEIKTLLASNDNSVAARGAA